MKGSAARLAALPVAVAAASAAVVAIAPGTASAHNLHYLWGDDEDTLSTTAVNQGDIVGLWQSLLDSLNSHIAVDGLFGPQTANQTALFDEEFAAAANGQVENGSGQSWSVMANTFVEPDSCDSSFCYYHAGVGGVSPVTSLALNRSNLNWKWRGDCVSGTSWHDANHPTIDVTGVC